MRVLDIFAGAGGGVLTAKLLGYETVCAVELNEFCRCVLVRRQNDGVISPFPIWDDIRTFDAEAWRGCADVVFGGFPCQAFSTAARGRNDASKDMWRHMLRTCTESGARYVFAENVSERAITNAANDLRNAGFCTVHTRVSARDMGADHVRERYWLLAYADDPRELLRGLNAEMALRKGVQTGIWTRYADEPRVADGVAHRVDRLNATGNGWVPCVAASALTHLAAQAAQVHHEYTR